MTFRQLLSVDSLLNTYVTRQEHADIIQIWYLSNQTTPLVWIRCSSIKCLFGKDGWLIFRIITLGKSFRGIEDILSSYKNSRVNPMDLPKTVVSVEGNIDFIKYS